MFRLSKMFKFGGTFAVFCLSFLLVGENASGAVPTASLSDMTFASNVAYEKIHASLMTEIEGSAPNASIQFVARIEAGANLDAYSSDWFARPFVDPAGATVASGFASPNALLKMAADPDVIALQKSESIIAAPISQDPEVASLNESRRVPQLNVNADASPGIAPEGWYGTTGAVHGSQDAWDKGYTGQGVKHMVNDSGADYCHTDLLGTWAYIDDPSSPYHGLPQMFDSWSSYVASFDFYLGTSFIAGGLSDYADTSATAAGNFSYAPLGADAAHAYTVPGTSLSGEYHYGSHPDKALADNADLLSSFFGDGSAARGERAAILVVDENTPGVYDTVYVDINYNYDFTDDTPARLGNFSGQETACLDYDFDGLNDVSGGLAYFISNGVDAVPTLDWYWGIPGAAYGPGDLVAFHLVDYLEGGGDHGMGCTSVAVGQGRTAGSLNWGPGGSPVADFQGLVVGPGKDTKTTQNGNFYITPFIEDAYIYAGLGYDGVPGNGDDIQIVSNSWGNSGIDNEGWDYESRLIDLINRVYAPNTALIFSTGNGAAGYGTVAGQQPDSGIGVGASTLFGSIGLFEPIAGADQIVGGDVISWSNRGPKTTNKVGADVVATGAFGPGDVPLNQVLWGAIATDNFGGTSMAGPVAAGNLSLMYQAWYDRTGEWPTFEQARELIMGTAKNTNHDVWSQGGGLVDADEGVSVAAGLGGVYASPSQWAVGDYRGSEYEVFSHIIKAGEQDNQTITLVNTGNSKLKVDIETLNLKLIRTKDYSFTSLDRSLDHGGFTTPDYAFQIDKDIPNATDLMQVRVTKPHDQFDPNQDLGEPFSNWRVHIQDWTDLNGDGEFWIDADGDGKVSATGEMQTGEHVRFTYGYNTGPTQQARVAKPLDRMTDGILLTLRHRDQVEGVDTTDLNIEASFWQWTNWSWVSTSKKKLTVPANGSASFNARIKIPPNTPVGMYEGQIVASGGNSEVIIPITVAVAADGTSFAFGDTNYKNGQTPLYDNENMFGYTDYGWRAESGDWRFYWTDVQSSDLSASGSSYLVVDNSWDNAGTDIDTLIYGPTADCFSNGADCPALFAGFPGFEPVYGPYTMGLLGGSANTYIGSGRWVPQTSTGGPRELVAAEIGEGLHGIFLHQVRVDGGSLDDSFGGETGLVSLDPNSIVASGSAGAGSATVSISSSLDLTNFVAEGYGLGAPETEIGLVFQDDPNDPSTASFVRTVTINNGALLEVSTGNSTNGSDLDLFVYDPSGNLVGSSTTPTDAESVSILFPEDGDYTVAVQGWSVPAGSDNFEFTVNAVQGFDLSVTDLPAAINAGDSADITINWDTTGFAPGTYQGLILMGPADAPGLFQIPVVITVN